jgi:hypothetical protein
MGKNNKFISRTELFVRKKSQNLQQFNGIGFLFLDSSLYLSQKENNCNQ